MITRSNCLSGSALMRSSFIIALATILLVMAAQLTPASAQLNIQIGGSEAEFKQRLARDGYDRIDTVKLGLSSSIFEACKGDGRFRIRFEWTGDVDRKRIGNCRVVTDEAGIRKILRDRGYRRITIEDRAGKYLAIGCLRGDRYRIELNYYGDIERERRVGDCRDMLSPEDVVAMLEEQGYERVAFTNRQPPRYVVQACRERGRFELVVDVRGEIISARRTGSCSDRLSGGQIVSLLESQGFTEAVLLHDSLNRFVAEACQGDSRFRLTLNRWGEITDRVYVGRCRVTFTEQDVEASMRDNGFRNVSVIKQGDRFLARGCRDNRYIEFTLASHGELINRRDMGSCDAPRINDLAETMRSRGLSELRFYVEACENRQRVRIRFDEFANRISRDVIGGC